MKSRSLPLAEGLCHIKKAVISLAEGRYSRSCDWPTGSVDMVGISVSLMIGWLVGWSVSQVGIG